MGTYVELGEWRARERKEGGGKKKPVAGARRCLFDICRLHRILLLYGYIQNACDMCD